MFQPTSVFPVKGFRQISVQILALSLLTSITWAGNVPFLRLYLPL